MASTAQEAVADSVGRSVLRFNSPLVDKMASTYFGLSQQGRLGFLIAFAVLWHRFGGKVLMKNGKIVNFLPSCEFIHTIPARRESD